MVAVAAPFRGLRSGAIGITILALAAGAHMLAGGALPVPPIMLALTALTALASVAVTGIRIPPALMAALLGASQPLLHNAFDLLSGQGMTGGASMAGMAGPDMHHDLIGVAAGPLPVAASMAHLSVGTAAPAAVLAMTVAHIAATLASAVVLAKGEEALWLLASWLCPLVQLPTAPAAVVVPSVSVQTPDVPVRPQPRRNLRMDCRRGPPATAVQLA